jgi:hypothetical protein
MFESSVKKPEDMNFSTRSYREDMEEATDKGDLFRIF